MTRTATNAPRPPSLLMNLVITLLAPMFLGVSDGNVHFARMAAIKTVSDYRARNNADLIAVAQIIAFGLAALGSLSLSLADEISINMALRLRGNANACHRSAEQNRRALARTQTDDPPLEVPLAFWTEDDTTPVDLDPPLTPQTTDVLAAEAANRRSDPDQTATETPSSGSSSTTDQSAPQKSNQELWAVALVKAASEITASLPILPQAEREAAATRAAALSDVAHDLLHGGKLPPPEPGASTAQPPL